MLTRRRWLMTLVPLGLGYSAALRASPTAGPFHIGMPQSMFRDVAPNMIPVLAKPFHQLIEAQTGLKSELLVIPTAAEMRKQLSDDTLQLGVFQGFEFAWERISQPALRPLMLAALSPGGMQSHIVVHRDSDASGFASLKGTTFALPRGSREHSRLYLERSCLAEGTDSAHFFGRLTVPTAPEAALHEVADNAEVKATIVDGAAFKVFEQRNPGRIKRLKTLILSPTFPSPVVAYRTGGVDEPTLRRFRDGMATAHQTSLGNHLMMLMRFRGFEIVPGDFEVLLASSLKGFPPPVQ